jgi:hypothetical protein
VTIDPVLNDEVTGVCAVLEREPSEVFREAWNALLGRRGPLTAAQLERLAIVLRGWHEERALKKPVDPEDD